MQKRKTRIGIVGCGAIGSRIAKSVVNELKSQCALTGLYDINPAKSRNLARRLRRRNTNKKSLAELIRSCDFLVEAINSDETAAIIRKAIKARKSVLAMSIGKLLNAQDLFRLAEKNKSSILLPSGAIAGIDAIKAASLVSIDHITLTTRKPPSGFIKSAYIRQKGINLNAIKGEKVIFDGTVGQAVKAFPENINVAATLALASGVTSKIRVRIMIDPALKQNSHEVEAIGEFGRMTSRTENVICPDSPKTSYLAALSAIRTLKQYFQAVKVGT
ncbi:MAG TPA: aspartate dehydrogenase [Candidatus Omnitrophota bacterium]|nr:aspartate dehydrogenase [Candidatus Omnitrophota bacterium]HPD85327.1 aspartate dehydrogenase [Candidatus Omnitrophota bacterium]HRZ04172.1 aspartate dehydrogenase [Candidatus Omnitrophota bacterium]